MGYSSPLDFGVAEQMIVRMIVRGKIGLVISLLSREIGDLSHQNVFGTDDSVLGFLYFLLGLVELGLRISPFLQCGELPLITRKQVVCLGKFLICLQERVQIATDDDLIFGKVFL